VRGFTKMYKNGIKIIFEFDQVKSEINRIKHGIDFVEAQALWFGAFLELPSEHQTELRSVVIGLIGSQFWTAAVTFREEKIRIISVRRSRNEEKEAYKKGAKIHNC
jgi:uncharacterized DUF497 family protein